MLQQQTTRRRRFSVDRKRETMKGISSSVKQFDVARKPQNLRRTHHRENGDSRMRNFNRNESQRLYNDLNSFSYPMRNSAENKSNHNKEKKGKKNDAERELTVSMRNLSLGIHSIPVARPVAKTIEIRSYIQRNIVVWTDKVFAKVGPGEKELKYHIELKNLLLSNGLDVGYEVPLRFERYGSKPIAKRVDLIVSKPGIPQRVLIECKAKKKLEKKDREQVLFYQHHFGIQECYLINFRVGNEVLRLK